MTTPEHSGPHSPGFHTSWQTLGGTAPAALVEPRIVVQHALIAVVGAAERLGERDVAIPPGWLEWLGDHHALASPILQGTPGLRVALRPGELTLLLLDSDGAAVKTRPLERWTVEEAHEWLRSELERVGADAGALGTASSHEVPALPEQLGGVLGCPDRAALAELERWLVNADHVVRAIARTTKQATAVRCPPDRLELLTELAHPSREGEGERVVAVGVSLGHADHPEPHLFVGARPISPVPAGSQLRWEVYGSGVRAVLPASAVVSHRDGEQQAAAVDAFLERAIPEAHGLVHREWRRR